jgi:hypothetical protein
MKKLIGLLLFAGLLFGADLRPVAEAKIEAGILDMVVTKDRIYLATDISKVVVMDHNFSVVGEYKARKIKDFMGELGEADVYSVDYLDGAILYLAQAEDGYAELYVVREGEPKKVLDRSRGLYAKAAKFVDPAHVIIALMSDEVVLYDLQAQKVVGQGKAGEYFFSVMAIAPERTHIAVGDEGGEVAVIDTRTLRPIKVFQDINKDKILSLDTNAYYAVAGSRADKTFALYDLKSGTAKTRKNPDFFVYVVGLDPWGNFAVYGDNEKYILNVVDTKTLDLRHRLVGHKNIVNVIRFADKKTILSASETGEIKKWRLP